jgi:hypothetical protein
MWDFLKRSYWNTISFVFFDFDGSKLYVVLIFFFCVISGGYNIKTGPGCLIELMKFDMGGSAAVLGAAKAIGQIKPLGVEVSNWMLFLFLFGAMNIILIDNLYSF